MSIQMAPSDWFALFSHFFTLSLLAVGGAISTVPEMHRFLVDERHWMTDPQFSSCISIAQSAPGPNVLFVALMGWNVGLNAAGGVAAGWQAWVLSLAGVAISMAAILVPSSVLTYTATQWSHRNRDRRAVRAFKTGFSPLVIGLLLSTGWLLSAANRDPARDWRLWLVTALTALVVWRTKVHLLWLIGGGAVLGALGWV